MRKITRLDLSPEYSILQVYNANLEDDYVYHLITNQTMDQGFSGFSESYNFYSLGDCFNLSIEIWLADEQESIVLKSDTVRALMVPFSSSESGIKIANTGRTSEYLVQIPKGEYALVFEIKLRNDNEYLNSESYRSNVAAGFSEECCYLTFYHREEPVQPELLRLDAWSAPPYDLQGYTRLNPTHPLVMREV
jgi:hypothetical protein